MPEPASEEEWRSLLTGDSPAVHRLRRAFRSLPSPPRCKLCHAPFGGIGGFVLRPVFGPWEKNPQICKNCIGALAKMGVGGAEVPVTLLFAARDEARNSAVVLKAILEEGPG